VTDLNKFVEWSKNNPGCSVDIEIGDSWDNDAAGKIRRIWVCNGELCTGQHVKSVDEIDLETGYRKMMERQRQEVEEYFQKTGGGK